LQNFTILRETFGRLHNFGWPANATLASLLKGWCKWNKALKIQVSMVDDAFNKTLFWKVSLS